MLNVERFAASPMVLMKNNKSNNASGMKKMTTTTMMKHLEFDDYLYSASPPRFSIADLVVIPQRMDVFAENFFRQVGTPPPEEDDYIVGVYEDPISSASSASSSNASSTSSSSSTSPSVDSAGKEFRKKKVSFADDFGKRLAEVCTYVTEVGTEERVRRMGTTTMDHGLHRGTTLNGSRTLFDLCPSLEGSIRPLPCRHVYRADFVQPVSNFALVTERLETSCVSLEYASVSIDDKTRYPVLTGKVLVKETGDASGRVFLRCTVDGWKSQVDVDAERLTGSTTAGFRAYSFSCEFFRLRRLSLSSPDYQHRIDTPKYPDAMEFAICCQSGPEVEFWDNNFGENYKFSRQNT